MGAGASSGKDKIVLENTMASREYQGKKLGVEYEVTSLRPKMKHVKLNEKYILRVGYEALVLLSNNEEKIPVTYFKYQDIISWGSTSKIFTFKVFGNAMSHHQPVAIVFSTPRGKEIEKTTLDSVHALMADMDQVGVTKTDFNTLKAVLRGLPVDDVMNTAVKAAVATAAEVAKSKSTKEHAKEVSVAADLIRSLETASEEAGELKEGMKVEAKYKGKAKYYPGVIKRVNEDGTCDIDYDDGEKEMSDESSMEITHGGVDVEVDADELNSSTPKPLEGEEFLNTVTQFATCRNYTVFQAVQLMEIAMENTSLDSFDRVNFAVSLWKSSLNRDSFQLVVNVFQEPEDKANVIARIQACNTDRMSSALLNGGCSDVGGGLDLAGSSSLKKPSP